MDQKTKTRQARYLELTLKHYSIVIRTVLILYHVFMLSDTPLVTFYIIHLFILFGLNVIQ